MSQFDPKQYEEQVVKPLRGWSGRKLPDDLLARYAVVPSMSDQDLAKRLSQVRSHWNKSVQGSKAPSLKAVYKAFVKEDAELRKTHGDEQLNRASWWTKYAKDREGKRGAEITELASTLRRSFGELGLISASQLKATMRATSASLTPAEADKALQKAGVRKADPVELPTQSGLPKTIYTKLALALGEAGVGSVPELLFGELPGFTVMSSFTAGGISEGLTGKAVQHAIDRENKRSNNQAAREALGILATAARDKVDLRLLTLYHLVEDARRDHGEGVPPTALLKPLLETKLDADEARLAVFSVLNESTRDTKVAGLALVTELLEEGRLTAAQQAVATIANAEEQAAAKAVVQRQVDEVMRLRTAARQALHAGDESEAQNHLRAAAKLAVDDEDIVAELRRIPPAPVLGLTAQPERLGVRLAWRPQPSHPDDTTYRLVRREDRAPTDPDDGVVAAEGKPTVVVDSNVPAGQQLHYAVFARTTDQPWSRGVAATIEVFPPVIDVRLSATDNRIEGRWQVHPDVRSVQVRRADGRTVATIGKTQFHDHVTGDGEHAYTLIANYRRANGSDQPSATVTARTAGGGIVAPVAALSLTAVAGDERPKIAITWKQNPDAEVTIRRSTTPAKWAFGAAVTTAQLVQFGDEVVGRRVVDGDWQTLTADAPTGQFHYTPFTIGPDGAICGHGDQLGLAQPVRDLRYQRLGDELVVSWIWPESSGTVEVSWRTTERSAKFRYTRQQYQLAGGCRVRCGAGKVDISVRSVSSGDGIECVSPEITTTVSEMLPKVTYTVESARKLIGPSTVRVRLTADQTITNCPVVVILAPGVVMPRRPEDGRVVLRNDRVLPADEVVELTAEFPKTPKPYWIRCFVEDGSVRLVDPPTSQLKVS